MNQKPRWSTVLTAGAILVMGAGGTALILPSAVAVAVESRALPVLSVTALALAVGLAADWRWLQGFLAVLGATLLIGWTEAADAATSTRHLAGACLGLLLMLILGRVVDTPQRLRFALLASLSGGLVVLVLGLAATNVPDSSLSELLAVSKLPTIRLVMPGLDPSGLVNPNALAVVALLVTAIGVSVVVLRCDDKRDRFSLQPLGVIVSLAGTLVLAVSRSRSAALAVWLTLVVLLVRGFNWWVSRLLVGALVVALPLLATGYYLLSNSHDELHLKADELWQTADHRVEILRSGIELLAASPWFGIGLNEFRHIYKPQTVYAVPHVHNVFLQTALDIGILGLGAYCSVMGFLLVTADRVARGSCKLCQSAAVGAALSLVSVSMFGITDAVALGAKVGLLQWMAAGLILAARRTQVGLSRKVE